MNITNLPNEKLIDENGNLNNSWRVWFNQITNQLQEFLSVERYKLPNQHQDEINRLNDVPNNEGGLLYNNFTNTFQVNLKNEYFTINPMIEYRFKTVVTYEEMTLVKFNNIPPNERNGRIIFESDSGTTYLGSNNNFISL